MQSTSFTTSEPAPSDSTIIRVGSDGRERLSPAQRQELLDVTAWLRAHSSRDSLSRLSPASRRAIRQLSNDRHPAMADRHHLPGVHPAS